MIKGKKFLVFLEAVQNLWYNLRNLFKSTPYIHCIFQEVDSTLKVLFCHQKPWPTNLNNTFGVDLTPWNLQRVGKCKSPQTLPTGAIREVRIYAGFTIKGLYLPVFTSLYFYLRYKIHINHRVDILKTSSFGGHAANFEAAW
jgi:hypothetical protein